MLSSNCLQLIFDISNMIRVAIAGTGGLAQYMAHYLATQTSHQFIMLSTNVRVDPLPRMMENILNWSQPNPALSDRGWQVMQVDYASTNGLRFVLSGIDTVLSTVSGNSQIALIDAAASMNVRRFVPAEFEGQPSRRPAEDVLDRGKAASLERLQYHQQWGMEYCVFVCGILYERFAPGGMGAFHIGNGCGAAEEGEYIMNVRTMKAEIPHYDTAGQIVHLCITSAHDLAKYVVAALDLPMWPTEFRLQGERLSAYDIVRVAEAMRGKVVLLCSCAYSLS